MDEQGVFMIAEAVAETFSISVWFSCGWFVTYGLLEPWPEVKRLSLRHKRCTERDAQLGPVHLSHILFGFSAHLDFNIV